MSTMYYPDMGAPSAVIDKYIKALNCVYNFYYITKTYKGHSEFVNKENVLYISSIWHKLLMFCNKNQNKVVTTIILAFINAHKLLMTQICNPNAKRMDATVKNDNIKLEFIDQEKVVKTSNIKPGAYKK